MSNVQGFVTSLFRLTRQLATNIGTFLPAGTVVKEVESDKEGTRRFQAGSAFVVVERGSAAEESLEEKK